MPPRKLVQIGKPAPFPTVAEYFRDLAVRQGEDIRLLKQRASEDAERRSQRAPRKSVRAESWRLHPVVSAGKAAKKRSPTRRAAPTKRAR